MAFFPLSRFLTFWWRWSDVIIGTLLKRDKYALLLYVYKQIIMSALTQTTLLGAKVVVSKASVAKRTNVVTRAGQYDDELLQTAVWISSLRLNFSSLFATWVKFFLRDARIDDERGKASRGVWFGLCGG